MKTTLISAMALAAGLILGLCFGKHSGDFGNAAPAQVDPPRSVPPDGSLASAPPAVSRDDSLKAAHERIQSLEAEVKDLREAAADGMRARVRGIEARIPELIEKKDHTTLVELAKLLTLLGPDGFPGALRILTTLIAAGEDWPYASVAGRDALDQGVSLDFLQWVIADARDNAPATFRRQAAFDLFVGRCQDVPAGFVLTELFREKDPGVFEELAGGIFPNAKEQDLPKLLDAWREFKGNVWVAEAVVRTLQAIGTPESQVTLQGLAADPVISSEVRIRNLIDNGPLTGMLVLKMPRRADGANRVLGRGDVLLAIDTVPLSAKTFRNTLLDVGARPGSVIIQLQREEQVIALNVPCEELKVLSGWSDDEDQRGEAFWIAPKAQ